LPQQAGGLVILITRPEPSDCVQYININQNGYPVVVINYKERCHGELRRTIAGKGLYTHASTKLSMTAALINPTLLQQTDSHLKNIKQNT
jgi:hypothetical protein